MPRTKEQNDEIRAQRIREILQAALLVYSEKGYAASEIGDIAERAGVARGLVYHYFQTKQKLFQELYEQMMKRTESFTEAHFGQAGSALDLFRTYARIVCKRVLEEPAIARYYTRIGLDVHYLYSDEPFAPLQWVKNFMRPMGEAIERGIREGTIRPGDANLMARQFWGAISQGMHYLEQLQEGSEPSPEEQLNAVLDQVVESALAVIRK